MINRRNIAVAAFVCAFCASAPAFAAEAPREISLWPGAAPGGAKVTARESFNEVKSGDIVDRPLVGVTRPRLTIYMPAGAKPSTAVLVIPGGGFRSVWSGKEGDEIARWLADNGVAAGVLVYRLPGDGWAAGVDVPMQDAARAMRLLRRETGAAKVGALGFSAGGTIAASLDARFAETFYPAVDGADILSAKPDFVGLGYPFLATSPTAPFKGFSKTPSPAFIFHAADDSTVPAEHSKRAYDAVLKAGGKAELHIFPKGQHGFALRSKPDEPAAAWPGLFLAWLKRL
jgi:acetyl esterase/lipase